jgi:hypothetical protein
MDSVFMKQMILSCKSIIQDNFKTLSPDKAPDALARLDDAIPLLKSILSESEPVPESFK